MDPGDSRDLRERAAPLEIDPETFRNLGHRVVDAMAELLVSIPRGPVTRGEAPATVRDALGRRGLPRQGEDPQGLLDDAMRLLAEHSLFNGHPRFLGYITSSAAPVGALGDLVAAMVNSNLGGWHLSPIASEIEAQTVAWIAELLGYPGSGGLLTSGGNMANFVGFWAARRHRLPGNVRKNGLAAEAGRRPRIYVSAETHTWIQKAADLSGLGTDAIRWIQTDPELRMDMDALRERIAADLRIGDLPFLVVGSAGTVSTGAIDPLREIAAVAREHGLWFHVDGAYGAPAASLPDASPDLKALSLADSVAVDPHKWLYAPLEAGCVLVREMKFLRDTFSYHPPYYPDTDPSPDAPIMYHELGPQNSRGFRALKVWLALRQAGREGTVRMIDEDIRLARALHHLAAAHPELEAWTQGLSITTFRFVPPDLRGREDAAAYLNDLNREIMSRLQSEGEVFLTNAVVGGAYLLRACVVNFRTTLGDIEQVPELTARAGRAIDATLRPAALRGGGEV
jgi:glutamate/tyrosine decarboxylase-like PLP-dependent enzyme